MDLHYLLTSFDGRIGRRSYWLGSLIAFVVILVAMFLGLVGWACTGAFSPSGPTAIGSADTRPAGIVLQVIMLLGVGPPLTAVMVKRLHDRDRPSWLVLIIWTPSVLDVLHQLSDAFGLGGEVLGVAWSLGLVSFAIGIWSLVELGLLPGTEGPNRYGAGPL